MRPRPIPVEALDYYEDLIDRGALGPEALRMVAEKFPEALGGTKLDSVGKRIRNEFNELGRPLPDARRNFDASRAAKSHKDFQSRHPEITIPYEPLLAIASDAHFPVHHELTCNRLLDTVQALSIPAVLFNGDQLHNDYKGHKMIREIYAASYDKGLDTFAHYLECLMERGVQRFYVIMGNHDDKPLRGTDGELSFKDWWETQVWSKTSQTATLLCAERYYLRMQPGPRQEFGWRFTHQQNYGQNALTVAKKIANKKLEHTMCGHQHHLASGKTQSNRLRVVDAGCLADPELAGYKEIRDSGHPEWTPGFVVLRHGVPELWDSANPNEWWEERLG